MSSLHVAVLAAGKGTRMKARRPKVLHAMGGLPLIGHVLRAARTLQPASIVVVVGYQGDELRAAMPQGPDLRVVVQEPQLGTGHALLQTEPALRGRQGTLLLLYADVPLIRTETLGRLVAHHESTGAAATVLTTHIRPPAGYGRILRDGGRIARIVEERDATAEERRVDEINTGVYAFDLSRVFDGLRRLATANSQGEYYLTDLVASYRSSGLVVETVTIDDATEARGVNSQAELAELGAVLRRRRADALMAAGVTIVDPPTTFVDVDVEVGPDTILYPNVYLEGSTRIGSGCEIHAGTRIVDSTIGDGVVIRNHCVVQRSVVGAAAVLGPFAHLRPDNEVADGAHVGNFVELKKTRLGRGSKANHLAYLGDATIGDGVNIGAGTITCNYDGTHKHRTTIEDGAFIGSDSQLVAPVRVGRGAYVAAGSSVTQDVPPGGLAVARARQVNKEGWATARRRERAEGAASSAPEPEGAAAGAPKKTPGS